MTSLNDAAYSESFRQPVVEYIDAKCLHVRATATFRCDAVFHTIMLGTEIQ